jgi:RND family efflux transporter MFP subunit
MPPVLRLRWLHLALIIISLALWALVSLSRRENDVGRTDDHPEIAVKTVRVKRLTAPLIFAVLGDFKATNEVSITSRIPGRLATVRYRSGDRIRKGAVVATVHSNDLGQRTARLLASVSAARANRLATDSRLVTAEDELEQKRQLFTRDLIPRAELEEAQSTVQAVRLQVELAAARLSQEEALLKQARALMALTELVAPISGVVTRLIEPGAEIGPSTPVVTIASLNEFKTVLRVPNSKLAFIHKGTAARLIVDGVPDDSTAGIVTGLQSSDDNPIDSAVEVTFGHLGRIPVVGQKITLRLIPDMPDDTLVIPRSAIIDFGGKTYVYRIVGARALRTEIALADNYEDSVIITKGLSEGESIVIEPPPSLLGGSWVRVRPATL